MKRQRSSRRAAAPRGSSKALGKLRIIGGDYRRRQLPVLDLPGLRPTPDRVRETLFNWLGPTLSGCRTLDLFAGSGALGIEALSRGARETVFIEREAAVAELIRDNLATLGAENARVITTDAGGFLDQSASAFDLVFLDPPFGQGLAEPCCQALEQGGWLGDEALIYLETERALAPVVPANWQLHRETGAGESIARLYRRG
ncbi:16S rRNA (guanine(966)-N(2))-methyltransferase RsmD [Vreelandella malpeensis]|uniref:Ribosomal RNA small subunit methyltransferase D n=1 Tax=Vreelandella malpeensis TaxID=1172368 RepID=A0ABS8DVY9_9GAMM|nr:16S rRNA (guanine(966)-N(2))-methyltransferase RsmD [Halomonas malpeensis]MCB8890508.1 16S rRNA (guanine(966)-N(2))-methyltransferase RsmD [Halomonas malpeensis]